MTEKLAALHIPTRMKVPLNVSGLSEEWVVISDDPESFKHARLIAKAPEMVEFIRAVATPINEGSHTDRVREARAILKEIDNG